MSEQFLIDDGYTVEGKIPRAAGVHPELRFTYRPALTARRNRYLDDAQKDKEVVKARGQLICEHVVSWSVKDHPKPTAELVEKLQPLLSDKLVEIVLGYAPSGDEATDAKN